ncbi:MAG: hypothetical protein N2053_06460, partial [Chitinispirillaceae bacterium]|nr:hypothetical protein [Chitinispirillaceae bacterium]
IGVAIGGSIPAILLMYLARNFILIENTHLKNVLIIITVSLPTLFIVYFLFDLTGIQSLRTTLKEISRKK